MAKMSTDVSYIRARDPSIRSYFYRDLLKKSRRNIEFFTDSSTSSDDSDVIFSEPDQEEKPQEEEGYIQIYLRIKPSKDASQDYIIKDNSLTYKAIEQPTPSISIKEKDLLNKYCFTKIFGPESKQTEIFNSIVKARVLEFINGRNSSLFTYGASGAGKTFTIVGNAEEPGLIPRALEYLFRTLPQLPDTASVKPMPDGQVSRLNQREMETEMKVKNNILESFKGNERAQNIKTYRAMQVRLSNDAPALLEPLHEVSIGIWVSFIEIYNEEIFDLLQTVPSTGKQKTKVRIGITNSNVYIKDLTHVNVCNGLEAFLVFQYGIQKLRYAETVSNNHSSRSHSIFSVKIAQALDNGTGVYISTFNFGDLAGVERSKKTKNAGDRLKESNSINMSLMVLGRCFAALRNSQKTPGVKPNIPFRESKLTQLLQRALSGLENLCMVVNINTSKNMIDENLAVLNFSAMTKEIVIKSHHEQEKSKFNKISNAENLKDLDEEIEKLELGLANYKEIFLEYKRNSDKNSELENKNIVEMWEEILNDNEKINEDKITMLKNRYERQFDYDCEKNNRHLGNNFERNKKRKLDRQKLENEKITLFQKKSLEQQYNISELKEQIRQLKESKKEVLETFQKIEENLLDKVKSNNNILSNMAHSCEEEEMNSFMMHEEECAFDS
ncbi:hypothetical protein WA026_001078 [Henosepilachna vigintioctopunctata]|uniref:Kinesin motor domain-containing protein n=1 Tax=Henosepilachna vigintioctopunctata TaxID=420089 RepID=A0AAW1V984_9CUCU